MYEITFLEEAVFCSLDLLVVKCSIVFSKPINTSYYYRNRDYCYCNSFYKLIFFLAGHSLLGILVCIFSFYSLVENAALRDLQRVVSKRRCGVIAEGCSATRPCCKNYKCRNYTSGTVKSCIRKNM